MTTIRFCLVSLFLSISLLGCQSGEKPEAAATDQIDLIVKGSHVVTMDAANTVIEDGAVAVDGTSSGNHGRLCRHVIIGLFC